MPNLRQIAVVACGVVFVALVSMVSLNAGKSDERRFWMYNIHTKETLDIVYKRGGKRIPAAMKKINWLMRDHRENKPTRMDPKLIDTLWEIHRELGSREPIHLISGYRSPKTNAMLRRTRGGQAKKSRHMLGLASDVHFPDVPVKHLRYAALVRENGGVGYYPTSALPFVHVDTGRVRHWPRMPRYELASLFPNGRTAHRPRGGGRISKRDVAIARTRHKKTFAQVAAYFDSRGQPAIPRPVRVASARREMFRGHGQKQDAPTNGGASVKLAALGPIALPTPARAPVTRPARVAATPPLPVLKGRPRLIERASVFEPKRPSTSDKRKLTELFSLAGLMPAATQLFSQMTGAQADDSKPETGELTIASLLARPQEAVRETPKTNLTGATSAPMDASAPSDASAPLEDELPAQIDRFGWASGWVTAPAYDDEHPEELHYRPFALGPLLTATSSPHDPALSVMVHPDVAGTLAFIDDSLSALPMKLRPKTQVAALMWTNRFTSTGSGTDQVNTAAPPTPASGLTSRSVRTALQ